MNTEASSIIEMFSIVGDPRIERAKRHSLTSILMIGLMSTVGGGEGFSDMEDFGNAHEEVLTGFLDLPHGIPSHDTFRRVFARLDPAELEKFLIEFTSRLGAGRTYDGERSKVVAIDGKTLRRSYDTANEQSALHIVSAWAAGTRLVLGQVAVHEKSNEITAIPALLKLIDVKGAIVTIDAMGCQKEIAKEIRDSGADYMLALKGNHGNLHKEVVEFFSDHATDNFAEIDHTEFETTEKDHGRIEIRKVVATADIAWSGRDAEWKDLQSFIRVTSTRIIGEKETTEDRYYISSLPPIASTAAEAIRGHWGIENRLHWMLDVNFREDYSRVRKDNAPRNLAVLRKLAINLLQACDIPKKSLRRKKLLASWSQDFLLSLVFKGF